MPRLVASIAIHHEKPHLDRLFDYEVPPELDAEAQPGVRVRVVFAGRLVSGVIIARAESSGFTGKLSAIRSLSGAEPVLSQEVAQLSRAVADRWAGTLSDVLRLAIPARHARVEREPGVPAAAIPAPPEPGGWSRYAHGAAFLSHLASSASGARATSEPRPPAGSPGRARPGRPCPESVGPPRSPLPPRPPSRPVAASSSWCRTAVTPPG